MPNHVQNRLEIIGDELMVKNVMNFIAGKKTRIDFDKIIPMPKGLEAEINSAVESAAKHSLKIGFSSEPLLAALERHNADKINPLSFNDKDWADYIQCLNNVRNTGFVYWYDWAVANWGTKWNAYSSPDERDTENTIFFETAWSSSSMVITKLSALFPDLKFYLSYADEDSGSNTGYIRFENGNVTLINLLQNQSKEAYDLYFELHPGRDKDYKLVGDKYEYIENE
jgi:hypothetical protein